MTKRADHHQQFDKVLDSLHADPDRSKILTALALLQVDSPEAFSVKDYIAAHEWLTQCAADHPEHAAFISSGIDWIERKIADKTAIPN